MAYGSGPSSILSVVAFACAAAAVLGYGPMLALVAMGAAVLAMLRREGLAGLSALVAFVVVVLTFVLPPGIALGNL